MVLFIPQWDDISIHQIEYHSNDWRNLWIFQRTFNGGSTVYLRCSDSIELHSCNTWCIFLCWQKRAKKKKIKQKNCRPASDFLNSNSSLKWRFIFVFFSSFSLFSISFCRNFVCLAPEFTHAHIHKTQVEFPINGCDLMFPMIFRKPSRNHSWNSVHSALSQWVFGRNFFSPISSLCIIHFVSINSGDLSPKIWICWENERKFSFCVSIPVRRNISSVCSLCVTNIRSQKRFIMTITQFVDWIWWKISENPSTYRLRRHYRKQSQHTISQITQKKNTHKTHTLNSHNSKRAMLIERQ